MSLKPLSTPDIPEMTSLVARAAFPKGNLYMRLRDELGTLYTDETSPTCTRRAGQPALPAWRWRWSRLCSSGEPIGPPGSDAVRARIDWKYALGLELTDAGFTTRCFGRVPGPAIQGKAEQLCWTDAGALQDKGW
jgi:transposase